MIKPDKKRCQAEITPAHSPMQLGPPAQAYRCQNKPSHIATEKRKGSDGKKGSMSLCGKCIVELEKRMPGYATLKEITNEKNRNHRVARR